MDKQKITEYFDAHACNWDKGLLHEDDKINAILDYADIGKGARVLDVACGTGVLFKDYLNRGVSSVTGVDISSKMIHAAQNKFNDARITLICADIENISFDESFDRCVVYNAFVHFPSPEKLISALCGDIADKGRLCIAHSMSRHALAAHHSGSAAEVSVQLMDENALAAIMSKYFEVDVKISDDEMYVVSGIKK